ncbi:hypothetical protein [Rickettsia endosymbiont of Rhinocyllus conicus]|uniref:hypothetical protein n=1 Tax=Rickettsia endosymbiont of Rhinocyllus conicus TaxID=3066252 RepID=UPI003132E443
MFQAQCFYGSETVIISIIPWGQAGIARINIKKRPICHSRLKLAPRGSIFSSLRGNYEVIDEARKYKKCYKLAFFIIFLDCRTHFVRSQ